MKRFAFTFTLLSSMLTCQNLQAADEEISPYAGAPGWSETKSERTQWFKDAKFGMFIHWGLYSPAGGYWPPNPKTGKKYPQHYSEWIRNWANVSEPEYGKLTKPLFRPDKGCTSEWAKLAKEAGMKYTVLTTKHHDGYTLFNAKTPYSRKNPITGSTNISPKGRDMVAEYANSVRKEGLKVGYYYSIIDWQHPHAYKNSRRWPIAKNADHSRYVSYMHSHIEQLFSDYGKSDIIWVDYSTAQHQGSTWKTRKLLTKLHKLQPQVITNNRFWNGLQNPNGDFFTPEKYVPATGFPGRIFEVCHTMNESFGYSHHDTKWKGTDEVIELLVDIVSKGGNLLMNVGPDAQGHIPDECARVLRETGNWLEVNGESIYGTEASAFKTLPFNGRSTTKQEDGNTYLYFHLFEWPDQAKFTIAGLKNEILGATLLGSNEALTLEKGPGAVTIKLPVKASNPHVSVVRLESRGDVEIDESQNIAQQGPDRKVRLLPEQARLKGKKIKLAPAAMRKDFSNIGFWINQSDYVEFPFKVHTAGKFHAGGTVTQSAGKYAVYMDLAVDQRGGGEMEVTLGSESFSVEIKPTGSWDRYKRVKLGELTIRKPGKHTLILKAKRMTSAGFVNIKAVELLPVD